MNIGVIYDFGINKGGGDFVMLNILEALNNTEHSLTLLTSRRQGFHESAKLFHKEAEPVNAHNVRTPAFLRHPYTIAFVARKVAKENYDLFVLSDDVPKCLSNKKVVCYVHYSHVARLKFKEYVTQRHEKRLKGRIAWWIHRMLFSRFYSTQQVSERWFFVANSAIVKGHTSETLRLDPKRIKLLHPPVPSASIHSLFEANNVKKEDLIVCLGRFERDKRMEDLIHALALLSGKAGIKVSLIGFMHDKAYVERLKKTIVGLGLESRVELILNAEREAVIERLLRAKALVHLAPREPFGIAVVEGMAAGCIPIVRKGVNGPWLEIIERGKYGIGFETIEELASAMQKAVGDYHSFDVAKIASRALEFSEKEFRHRFLTIFAAFLAED
jgi:glycosyltransferase involved in cell wall biosynthesis